MNTFVETLIDLGGNRWTKGDYDRVYFNTETILKLQGIEWSCFKTGNVSWNNYGSNNAFNKLWARVSSQKHFYDIKTGKWYGSEIKTIIEAVKERQQPVKTKSSIMKRAWTIAKEAVKKFGGNVKEYFAQSLKLAWAE